MIKKRNYRQYAKQEIQRVTKKYDEHPEVDRKYLKKFALMPFQMPRQFISFCGFGTVALCICMIPFRIGTAALAFYIVLFCLGVAFIVMPMIQARHAALGIIEIPCTKHGMEELNRRLDRAERAIDRHIEWPEANHQIYQEFCALQTLLEKEFQAEFIFHQKYDKVWDDLEVTFKGVLYGERYRFPVSKKGYAQAMEAIIAARKLAKHVGKLESQLGLRSR